MMDLAQLRDAVERPTTTDLFRWERLPAYEVASDGSDYRRYLDGDAEPTWARKQPWLDTLASWAREGRHRRRVRYLHNPLTDYERYACEWGYALNAAAGEEIRVLPSDELELPQDLADIPDFWLIDGRDAVLMIYEPDGQFVGAELITGTEAARYQAAASLAWRIGKDFAKWWCRHPEQHNEERH